jgi:hypothetical protein
MTWTNSWKTIMACIKEPPMNYPKRVAAESERSERTSGTLDSFSVRRPTRPPTADDFFVDLGDDPIRWFRISPPNATQRGIEPPTSRARPTK